LTKLKDAHKIKFMKIIASTNSEQRQTNLREAGIATEESWLDAIEALVEIRKRKNMTQKDVGIALGVSQEAVSQFESGEANPSIRRIKLYALAVGASVNFSIIDSGQTPDYHLQASESAIVQRTKPGPKPKKPDLSALINA
jgi:transcriptional regulator with XRE-family HTH domain